MFIGAHSQSQSNSIFFAQFLRTYFAFCAKFFFQNAQYLLSVMCNNAEYCAKVVALKTQIIRGKRKKILRAKKFFSIPRKPYRVLSCQKKFFSLDSIDRLKPVLGPALS